MSWRGALLFLARAMVAGFFLVTSVYCILTYIPFTYQQVHVGGLLPWLTTFVHIHPYVYCIVFAIVIATLLPDLGRRRKLAIAFVVAMVAAGIGLLIHPVLANLENNVASIGWSLAALVPLVWLAAIDWAGHRAQVHWTEAEADEGRRVFRAAWHSAAYLAPLYALVLFVRAAVSHSVQFTAKQWAWAFTWTALSHLLFFVAMFVVLEVVLGIAGVFHAKRRAEFLGSALMAAVLVWLVFRSLIFPPLSFRGWIADGVAAAIAIAMVAFATGLSVRLVRPDDNLESGLALLLAPMRFLRRFPMPARIAFFVVLAGAAYFLESATAILDWEYLLQKLAVLIVWSVTFAAFYAIAPAEERKRGPGLLYVTAAVVLAAYLGLVTWQPREPENGKAESEAASIADDYANYDVSFRLADELLATPGGETGEPGEGKFFTFLVENTHISRTRPVQPVEVNLVEKLQPATGPRPHIFIFVIDSLRRDYLGAYNPAVDFTPAMDAFARESVVMKNAFTRYGGTGLSEPSIWVGGLMLHKEYVTPFQPMNALKKLVDAEDYDGYISKDTILDTVVGTAPEMHELDSHINTMYYDFCNTLGELERTLPARTDTRPVFVYTQPQNIHVSVIDREGRSVPPGETFPAGFNPPYASRVKRMDKCFGEFIASLKKSGMYDNSVIVLTADHGDSLGERGRWGHAYVIYPEIVRVPLIIHLPAAMKAKLAYDANAPSFLTDITPTLYYLLGQRPIVDDPMYGRPLFTETMDEQKKYERDAYLVVSSYAPVYGELTQDGQNLYIVDAVSYKDYDYRLNEDGSARSVPINDQFRAQQQGLIKQQVQGIARFYHLQ